MPASPLDAKRARQKWVERLEYLERELKRMPEAISLAKRSIAHWEKRLLELDQATHKHETRPIGPLTREDNRWSANYSGKWRTK